MHTFDRAKNVDGDYVYVVGWIDPHAQWHPLRDCKTASEAARFVNYLNGGQPLGISLTWEE
jgi:hypothetical protein